MKLELVVSALASAAFLGCGPTPARPTASPGAASARLDECVTVLPLGDSITKGQLDDPPSSGYSVGGYRTTYWALAQADGKCLDFVGTLNSGPTELGDRDHEGHPGWTIKKVAGNANDGLDSIVDSTIAAVGQPDLVLLLAGANNISGLSSGVSASDPSRTPPGMIADLEALIRHLHAKAPAARLFVAELTPYSWTSQYTVDTEAFNALLPGLVSKLVGEGFSLWLVPMYDALTMADIGSGGVHPTLDGYQKMGARWYAQTKDQLCQSCAQPQGDAGRPDAGDEDAGAPNLPTPVLQAARAAACTVDGTLDEPFWQDAPKLEFTDPGGASENRVGARAAWDATRLYFAFEVSDSALKSSQVAGLWNDDGVELLLDARQDRASSLQTDDLHVIVTVAAEAFVGRGTGGGEQDVTAQTGLERAFAPAAGGYVVELSLPWTELGVNPVGAGAHLGLLLANNDLDESAVRQFAWSPATNFKDPSQWGSLVLLGDQPPDASTPPADGGPIAASDAGLDAGSAVVPGADAAGSVDSGTGGPSPAACGCGGASASASSADLLGLVVVLCTLARRRARPVPPDSSARRP